MSQLTQTTPAAVFQQMGLRYLGRQALGKGRPDAYLFDHSDNSTLLMDGPVTVDRVNAKLAEHDEACRMFHQRYPEMEKPSACVKCRHSRSLDFKGTCKAVPRPVRWTEERTPNPVECGCKCEFQRSVADDELVKAIQEHEDSFR